MDDREIARAARRLCRNRLDGTRMDALPGACRPPDEAAAYAVQERVNELLADAGLGPVAGFKIGCTTPVMQAYIGISQPCAGAVAGATAYRRTARLAAAGRKLGVECELAVRLASPLAAGNAPFGRDSVAAATAAAMASIEIVEDRYADWRAVDGPTLIADNFFNAGIVLGPEREDWRGLDLAAVRGRMTVNGSVAGTGRGGDIMGHPLDALAWLANLRAAQGRGVPAGAFVSLGSLVETVWVSPGDRIAIALDGLGSADLAIE